MKFINMNLWSDIHLSYIYISIFLSGFALYFLIKFIYLYAETGRKVLLSNILTGISALLYIAGETAAITYYKFTSDYETARIFVLIRELSALPFIIAVPYAAEKLLFLKRRLKKFNLYLFYFAAVSSLLIFIISVFSMELIIGERIPGSGIGLRMIVAIEKVTALLVMKDTIFIIYLIYLISVIFYSKFSNRIKYPITKIYLSLIVLAYFALSSFFFMIFYNNGEGFLNPYFPYLSAGIALFLLLNTFSLIDILVDYAKKLLVIEKDLKQIVYEDSETGLPNRNGFIKNLQEQMQQGDPLTFLFIDIDDFQNVNESFGEKTGDEILKLMSVRLSELYSMEGKIYRIGGDDFVFVLNSSIADDEAAMFAKRLIASFRNPFSVSGVSHMLTVSIGIIQSPRDGNTINAIMNNAYSVVRNAKETKNSYRIYSKEMADQSIKRINIVNLLRSSINMDQFELFYQPVVDAESNLVYAESLLRCTNPDPAIGGPGVFIPLMEKAGLIKEIDDMVIRKAFHDMEMRIKKRFCISINLSSNQLINPAYSDFLYSFSQQHGIEPSMITLEVVENTLIENLISGKESILRLKEKGFKIAIDDFGKGYSSLSYISELPVDVLKIDMAFVQSLPGDPKKESVASHIMNLAHSLELKVVAEGFEKREQVEFFRNIGCDNFQGYYFSRPLPLDELLKKYFP